MSNTKTYILIKEKAVIGTNSRITLKEIADIYCKEESIKNKLENVTLLKTKDEEDWIKISSIFIIEKLGKKFPDLDIEIIGENEVLIEIKDRVNKSSLLNVIKVSFIFILLFLGSGITITNFHTDVDMEKTMEIIYRTLSGKKNSNPLILVIPYSIGLGIGVITFFNRIITRNPRRKREPGPMEIEHYNYDKDMEEYILNDLNKE